MFRNQYDTDVTTFSPAGRLHQVEYAMEAVKQGSCSVGVRSSRYVVVASLKRSSGELASYQQKVFKLDAHMGIAVSGLISDARVLANYMRNECLNHRYVFAAPMQTERLVVKVSDKAQVYTQKAEKRPYGVGLLVAGYDKTGPHLFQTDPSGVYFEFKAQAIGARAQSSKTYLEKMIDELDAYDLDATIHCALTALKGASPKKLTSRNVTIGFVGVDREFTVLEGDELRPYVGRVTNADDEDEDEEKKEEKEDDEDDPMRREAEIAAAAAAEEKKREDQEEEKEARDAAMELVREENP